MKFNLRSAIALLLLAGAPLTACDRMDNGTSDSRTDVTPVPKAPGAADNTAINERDRDGLTALPTDQSENEADLALTQRIRQALTESQGFSVNAQNIKIVTANGRVTLRGPVDTVSERDRIVVLATTIAGEGNVDDQLELK